MHQQSGWTATPSRLIGAPTSAIPTIFTQDALPYTTFPIYPGLGGHQICWIAYMVIWHQKGKTNLDFTEARDSEWQWHQLGHMQICTSPQTDNNASTSTLNFLQARCSSCRPTNSVKALRALLDHYSIMNTEAVVTFIFYMQQIQ